MSTHEMMNAWHAAIAAADAANNRGDYAAFHFHNNDAAFLASMLGI